MKNELTAKIADVAYKTNGRLVSCSIDEIGFRMGNAVVVYAMNGWAAITADGKFHEGPGAEWPASVASAAKAVLLQFADEIADELRAMAFDDAEAVAQGTY